MSDRFYPVWVVTQREVRDQFRDWRIIFPVIVLTLIFPWIMYTLADRGLAWIQGYGGDLVGEQVLPFIMLMVGFFPISVSLAVALESFVGEKERRSIEPLLSSPLEDWQLYLGKLVASLVLPMFASYLGTLVFLLGIYRQVGWVPEPLLIAQSIPLIAVQCLLMVSGAVVISSQTTSVRAANLLAAFIVLPMALLVQVESIAMFWGYFDILWWSILGQILLAALLVRMGVARFNREELLGRELDSLNLRWAWQTFRGAFTGNRSGLVDWIRGELPPALSRLKIPVRLTSLLFLASLAIGFLFSNSLPSLGYIISPELIAGQITSVIESKSFFTLENVPAFWLQNIRATSLAMLIGIFTFSTGGLLVHMLPYIVIGFVLEQATRSGFTAGDVLVGFLLPHGLLEIPALVLSGAAILRMGATLVTPVKNKTVGDVWLGGLADWAKVMLALVLPLLLGAALLEALVTPYVALWVFSR